YSLYKKTRMGGFDVIKILFPFKLTSVFTERKKFPEKDAVSKIEKRCGKFFNFFFFYPAFFSMEGKRNSFFTRDNRPRVDKLHVKRKQKEKIEKT
ncbi:hypothetical protein, partial [Micromonospora noduli]|uniref:hypothetical protein n=1 Tax=Micromonospora noduli TaxID=709876 RepID=UPI001B87D862